MLFSPDFLALFEATGPLLELDPSLWCISSWNDNGLSSFDWNASRLVRMPGWTDPCLAEVPVHPACMRSTAWVMMSMPQPPREHLPL